MDCCALLLCCPRLSATPARRAPNIDRIGAKCARGEGETEGIAAAPSGTGERVAANAQRLGAK